MLLNSQKKINILMWVKLKENHAQGGGTGENPRDVGRGEGWGGSGIPRQQELGKIGTDDRHNILQKR